MVRRLARSSENSPRRRAGSRKYRLYVYPNLDWGSIDLLLVADHFPNKDYIDNYVAISDFIDAKWKTAEGRPQGRPLSAHLRAGAERVTR